MAPLRIPTPGVRYRIQNVELSTCLERDSLLGNLAMLRRRSERPAQLWTFDEVSTGIFNITNVDAPTYTLAASSSSSPPGFTLTAEQRTGTTQLLEWELKATRLGSFYLLNNINILLHLDKGDGAVPKLTQDLSILSTTTASNLNRPPFSKGPEDRWSIIEDSPTALPDGTGTYVIQTLKGDAIQSAASPYGPAMLSFKISHLGEEHKWEIKDLGNGKATIRSTLVDQFIDAQPVGLPPEWTPVLAKATQPPQWDIRILGNLLFSITVEVQVNPPPASLTRLALTVLNDVIVLKNNMNVQNQQWSLVPTELASFKPLITVNPTASLPVGEYALRTSYSNLYTWVDSASILQASPSDRGFYFTFDLAAGNDGAGLGNAFISSVSGYPTGFLTAMEATTWRVSARLAPYKEIWCVQMKGDPSYCCIIHVATSRRLVSFYTDPNRPDLTQIGLEIAGDRYSNPNWALIPKP